MSTRITLPSDPRIRAIVIAKALEIRRRGAQLANYMPHTKQLEAHTLGLTCGAVGVFGGNRTGKSVLAAAETTYHLTGQYPYWWPGRRWKRPTKVWVASESYELTRDGAQTLLMGSAGELGTGTMPKDTLGRITMKSGTVRDCIDTVRVRHVSGGWSELGFRAYNQGRAKFQAVPRDFIWLDEEPDWTIYDECSMRVFDRHGYLLLAFTPLKGMSQVCMTFLKEPPPVGVRFVNMSWSDNPYLDPEEIKKQEARMLPHQREARQHGRPILGAGAVLPVEDSLIRVSPFQIPDHWPRGIGMDFGWTHPTAIVWQAHDRTTDTVYLYNEYRAAETPPVVHTAAAKALGDIPVFGDPSGQQSNVDDGEKLLKIYADLGLDVIPADNAVHTGILEMFHRMITGRFKVFSTCPMWFSEKQVYQYNEKGQLIKEGEDLICASRYGLMSLGQFRVIPVGGRFNMPTNHGYKPRQMDPRHGGS